MSLMGSRCAVSISTRRWITARIFRFFLPLCLLFFGAATSSSGGPSPAQSAQAGCTSSAPCVVSLTNPTPSGNKVLVFVTWNIFPGPPALASAQATLVEVLRSDSFSIGLWQAVPSAPANFSVTLSNFGSWADVYVAEFSGIGVLKSAAVEAGTGKVISSVGFPTIATDMVFAWADSYPWEPLTAKSGFSQIAPSFGNSFSSAESAVSAGGIVSPGFTSVVGGQWALLTAIFAPLGTQFSVDFRYDDGSAVVGSIRLSKWNPVTNQFDAMISAALDASGSAAVVVTFELGAAYAAELVLPAGQTIQSLTFPMGLDPKKLTSTNASAVLVKANNSLKQLKLSVQSDF